MDDLRIFRVVVRGHFADIDDDDRLRLLADVDQHNIFDSEFTRDGCWTYDRSLVAFNFRYETRGRGPTALEDAQATAERLTRDFLEAGGVGYKHLRSSVTDMSEMWR